MRTRARLREIAANSPMETAILIGLLVVAAYVVAVWAGMRDVLGVL